MTEGKKTEDNIADMTEDSIVESNETKNEESVADEQSEDNNIEETEEEHTERAVYSTDEKGTYKNGAIIANFKLAIVLILSMVDVGEIVQRLYKMVLTLNGKDSLFTLTAEEFSAKAFMPAIYREVGPDAILYGASKDLLIAVQESISEKVPEEKISLNTGFTPDYKEFQLPMMRITSSGIQETEEPVVDLSNGNLARKINFLLASDEKIKQLTQHLVNEFTSLKPHTVMYMVLGHVALSPFASWIVSELGKQKYTLHLKGPSGGGKTFIANLAGSFSGDFGDQMASWSGTANSIEMEGYHFRDLTFTLDDHKGAVILKKEVIRVIQNHADNRGRGRLNSSLKIQRTPHIRGLLLSTGEDFVDNVESVTGRTIILEVEPEHDQAAGKSCKDMQHLYKGFIPRFVSWVISQKNWQDTLKAMVDRRISDFSKKVTGISNGLRIATNLALNAAGFEMFCLFAVHVDAINDTRCKELIAEYEKIAEDHLKSNQEELEAQNPVAVFYGVLEHLLATEVVIVSGLIERNTDTTEKSSTVLNRKIIGKVIGTDDNAHVYIFPDSVMKHLSRHFKDVEEELPFDKNTLRDALVRDGHIIRANGNRITKQIRHNGGRVQAWQFNLTEFKKQCIVVEDIENTNNKKDSK